MNIHVFIYIYIYIFWTQAQQITQGPCVKRSEFDLCEVKGLGSGVSGLSLKVWSLRFGH